MQVCRLNLAEVTEDPGIREQKANPSLPGVRGSLGCKIFHLDKDTCFTIIAGIIPRGSPRTVLWPRQLRIEQDARKAKLNKD